MITWDNYEEYMVMQADGELNQAQEQELMNFLFEHPELQAELTTFTMLKLKPDNEIVYSKKAQILKPVAGGLVMKLNNWKQYAVAAGIALLMTIGGYNVIVSQNSDNVQLANANRTSKRTIATNIHSQVASIKDIKVQDVNINAAPQVNKSNNTPVAVLKSKNERFAIANDHKVEAKDNDAFSKPDMITFEPIDAPATKALAINMSNDNPMIEEVSIGSGFADNNNKQGFLDKLPISELKKGGLREVAASLTSGYEKVHAAKEEIYATDISVKFEKRKIVVSF